MASDDDRRRRKSRKHESSSRDKHRRSGKESSHGRRDDDRHHKERDGDSHDRKSSRRDSRGKGDDGHSSKNRESKLTEEEERLYAKAQEYLKREEEGDRGHRKHHKHGKESKRRRSESHDSSASDVSTNNRREKKRHRDRKEHKRSKRDDDHEKSRHKKKSKHRHRDEEKERHKKDKKHGSKSNGKSEESSSFKDKSTRIDPSNLVSLGNVVGEPPADQLDPEQSYFSHNSHLRLYLYRKFGIYFEDLTSSESHDAFKDFAKAYNAGNLEKAYYDSSGLLPQEALDQCQRTKHKWTFRTNRLEEQSLEMVRAGVKKQTEYHEQKGAINNAAAMEKSIAKIAPRREHEEDDGRSRRKTPAEMAAQRHSDKQHRERIKIANEEMHGMGKTDAGSWERKLEKKRQQSDKVHGAARDRESEAWGGAELDDDAIYGTGGGVGGRGRGEASYDEALAKERRYRERKEAEKASRTSELMKKEEEKQKKMFEMLGLTGMKAGQKIKIAPRNDG